jgi:hypothetical protein
MATADRQQRNREDQIQWLEAILADNRWTSAQLANRAGFHPSKLVNFKRDKSGAALLDDATVAKIRAVTGRDLEPHRPLNTPRHFEPEAADVIPMIAIPSWFVREDIQALIETYQTATPYLVVTNTLIAAGYRAGGLIFLDANRAPRSNDVIVVSCAGGPPLLRMFTMPMLYTCPFPPDQTQVSLLNDETKVEGVVACYAFGRLADVPHRLGADAFLASMGSVES